MTTEPIRLVRCSTCLAEWFTENAPFNNKPTCRCARRGWPPDWHEVVSGPSLSGDDETPTKADVGPDPSGAA